MKWESEMKKLRESLKIVETERDALKEDNEVMAKLNESFPTEIVKLEDRNEQLKKELADAFAELVSAAPPYYEKWQQADLRQREAVSMLEDAEARVIRLQKELAECKKQLEFHETSTIQEDEIERLEKELARVTEALNDATNNVWSAWELEKGDIKGQNMAQAFRIGELEKDLALAKKNLQVVAGMQSEEITFLKKELAEARELYASEHSCYLAVAKEASRLEEELATAQVGELAALRRVDEVFAELTRAVEKCVERDRELAETSQLAAVEISLLRTKVALCDKIVAEMAEYKAEADQYKMFKAFWEQSRLADQQTFEMYSWKEATHD